MLGAIIGDIAGSRFERSNHKTEDIRDFELFGSWCRFTDDTVMTLAVARALLETKGDRGRLPEAATHHMRSLGRAYPRAGYGSGFKRWLRSDKPEPYQSFGNGAGMRVSPCGWAAESAEEAAELSRMVTAVTHDHPEGLRGAEAVAVGVYHARRGASPAELRELLSAYYKLDFTLEGIRPDYYFDVSCQGSVPQALTAFLEAKDFEEAVRLAISVGGDTDTIAAMAGGLAEAKYGIPGHLRQEAFGFLTEDLADLVQDFEAVYPPRIL
jgi:type I restriction enzyme M protein